MEVFKELGSRLRELREMTLKARIQPCTDDISVSMDVVYSAESAIKRKQ